MVKSAKTTPNGATFKVLSLQKVTEETGYSEDDVLQLGSRGRLDVYVHLPDDVEAFSVNKSTTLPRPISDSDWIADPVIIRPIKEPDIDGLLVDPRECKALLEMEFSKCKFFRAGCIVRQSNEPEKVYPEGSRRGPWLGGWNPWRFAVYPEGISPQDYSALSATPLNAIKITRGELFVRRKDLNQLLRDESRLKLRHEFLGGKYVLPSTASLKVLAVFCVYEDCWLSNSCNTENQFKKLDKKVSDLLFKNGVSSPRDPKDKSVSKIAAEMMRSKDARKILCAPQQKSAVGEAYAEMIKKLGPPSEEVAILLKAGFTPEMVAMALAVTKWDDAMSANPPKPIGRPEMVQFLKNRGLSIRCTGPPASG